jgi:hypothetical protein
MELDLDTFLVAVYCLVDDLYRERFAPLKPARPGRRPELSDGEVLTLLVLAQWQPGRSERAFVRYAAGHWRAYFPRLLSQSALNRRGRDLCGVLCALGPALAQQLGPALRGAAAYEVLDGAPVPLMRCCRGRRHRCFGAEAGFGRGGSDRALFYGVRLLAVVDPAGLITGFVVGPAGTAERWPADALLRWRRAPDAPAPTAAELAAALGPAHGKGGRRQGPSGPLRPRLGAGAPAAGPYLADRGFAGAAWGRHWRQDYGAAVLTRADYAALGPADRRRAARWLSGLRQLVETAFGTLADLLGLSYPRARSDWGLLTRLGAKVAALNLLLAVNHLVGRPAFARFSPLEAA